MKYFNKNEETLTGIITSLSVFLLGYLNAFSTIFYSSVISPQTGNLVNLGVKLGQLDFTNLTQHFILIFGFAAGCIIASMIMTEIKKAVLFNWTIFLLVLGGLTVFHQALSRDIILLAFSFLAGLALTFFRAIGKLDINNGIMTGNLKNLYCRIHDLFSLKKTEHKTTIIIYFFVILLFFSGAYVGGVISKFGSFPTLIIANIICLLPYFICFIGRKNN